MNKKYLLAVIILIALALGAKFLVFKGGPPPGAREMPPPVVETAKVKKIVVTDKIETVGRVESPNAVDVTAWVEGDVIKTYVKEGAYVKKGDLLFLIDPLRYEIAYNQAKAGLSEAVAALQEAEQDLVRLEELVKKDYASKAQYDDVLAVRDRAKATLSARHAALNEAERNLDNTRVYARISGKIGSIKTTEGNVASPVSGSMTRIVSLNPIYVRFSINSNDYLTLKKNKITTNKVEIKLPDNSIYPEKGQIAFFDNEINPATGTIEARAVFKNPEHLLIPGQYVSVAMHVGQPHETLAIPQEAALDNVNGKYVYVLNKDSTAKIRPIKTNREHKGYWTLTDGLEEGEKIVIKGTQKLRPDMKVVEKAQEKDGK